MPERPVETLFIIIIWCSGRASKKINHLDIDPTKTWRDNGFGLLAIP